MLRRLVYVLAVLLLLAACNENEPEVESKSLVIYSFSEYIPTGIIEAFENDTGVDVTLETYSTNEEMLVELERNPKKYDVIIPSDYAVEILIDNNALQPLDMGDIPNYNNIETDFLSPYFDPGGATAGRRPANRNEKYSLPYLWGTTGIAYDTTQITEPITRWSDLWRPELAGHIVVIDDAREMMGMALLVLGYDKNDTNPDHLAEARDKLAALTSGIVAYDADIPENYIVSGLAWAGVVYNGNAAIAAGQNPNIVYVYPDEGAGIWFDNLAIPKDAPHADAAIAFINFVLKPEQSIQIMRQYPYSNPNHEALEYLQRHDRAAYDTYQNNPATNPPQSVIDKAILVKNVDEATTALFEAYWAAAKPAQ